MSCLLGSSIVFSARFIALQYRIKFLQKTSITDIGRDVHKSYAEVLEQTCGTHRTSAAGLVLGIPPCSSVSFDIWGRKLSGGRFSAAKGCGQGRRGVDL